MEEMKKKPDYRMLLTGGEGEIIEKKSRFIATVRSVQTEKEATDFIEEMKKKYWDARHNCSAFVIGERNELSRCSDDGEPSGTAGRPMLEVLMGEELHNTAVVVTRYFGGVLLGTGGLLRADTHRVKAGLENSEIGVMKFGARLNIGTDYNGIGKILYILGQRGIEVQKSNYTDTVEIEIMIPETMRESLTKEITEATAARAKISFLEQAYFVDKEKNA